jgi:cation diffusion facilitator CzcD-associated flavoprotein CzcO
MKHTVTKNVGVKPSDLTKVSALVVGAGFGGLGAGVYLKRAGIYDFRIVEQADGLGGTWWDNHYPGAEVDVHSHLYSYPFKRFDWTRTHARQPELQRYINELVDEHDLMPHISLSTRVLEAVWDDDQQSYLVPLSTGEVVTARVLISAVGLMNVPQYPDWPGLDDFKGPHFHTSRWEHEHDLTGQRVAVVGVGSTGAQVVPTIAPIVEKLYLFQREPGWVLPKGDRDYTPEERLAYAHESEWSRRKARTKLFIGLMRTQAFARTHSPNTKRNEKAKAFALAYLDQVFADRPDLKAALTPQYPFAGKRTVVSSDFYPALLRDNVELIPRGVASVTPTGIVDSGGVETPVDVLVMATGFQQANVLGSLPVVGREGKSLHDVWGAEPRALLGITVPGFPNFFMLYGPNTNGGEIFMNHRSQIRWAVRSIKRIKRRGGTIEARTRPFEIVDNWIQSRMKTTSWVQANNYYKSSTGRVATQWPFDALTYNLLTRVFYRVGNKHVRARRARRRFPFG